MPRPKQNLVTATYRFSPSLKKAIEEFSRENDISENTAFKLLMTEILTKKGKTINHEETE